MFDTRNDLPAKVREQVAELLNTADLFTGISRETDKFVWFLEAHLHAKR